MKLKKAKNSIKYYYYKTLCILMNNKNSDLKNINGFSLNHLVKKIIPGRDAARLLIKGKVSGPRYKKWLCQLSFSKNLDCWVKEKNKKTLEIILVGTKKNINIVIEALWKNSHKAKVTQVKEHWFDKTATGIVEGKTIFSHEQMPSYNVESLKSKFTVTFAGDTSLSEYFLRDIGNQVLLDRLENNPLSFFEGVKPLIENSNHFIVNLETVLAENPKKYFSDKKYANWDNPKRTLLVLKKIGVTAVSLANNHVLDYGPEILLTTIQKLEQAGINTFGAGNDINEASNPLSFELKGENRTLKLYVFTGMWVSKKSSNRYVEKYNYFATVNSPGVNPLDLEISLLSITRLREKEPEALIIVCPHWQGFDYKWVSSKLKRICRGIIDAGANYVFAHGNHMANHIEKVSKGIIAYSMGNFVFTSSGDYKLFNAPPFSLVIKLYIEETKNGWNINLGFYPIITDNMITDFNTRIADKRESIYLYNILYGKVDKKDGFFTSYRINDNTIGPYYTIYGGYINGAG